MKIQRVDIQGFKSFADRVQIRFDRDVTSIVGPNGCGKSNISDAIRWVMGEQSMKRLRGHALEDVIFSGSDSRSAQSMAEVMVTFDNSDGLCPPDYAAFPEIVVARRFFRDGTSEYIINKTPARLKDIRGLFMGTGAAVGAYSMIEQGRIGWIVTSRPEDKRKLIEEAAGITSYRVRRAEAERKIDLTKQDLARTKDRVSELEKNLSSLHRQAQKARRYEVYHGELVECELYVASHQFLEMFQASGHMARTLDAQKEKKLDLAGTVTSREGAIEANRGKLFATELEYSRLKESHYEQTNRVSLLGGQVERGVAEMGNLRIRAAAAADEQLQHGKRREDLERERKVIEGSLGEMVERQDAEERRKSDLAGALILSREAYDASSREVDLVGTLVVENARRRTALAARMDEIGRLLEGDRRRGEDLDREAVAIADRLVELTTELDAAGREIARAEKVRRSGESRRAGLLQAVDTFKGAIRRQDGTVEADAEALSAAKSRLGAIMERIDRRERQRGPVRQVQEASRKVAGSGVLYPLSESLTCGTGCEAAVAAVLEPCLDALVVDSHADVVIWNHFMEVFGRRGPSFVPRSSAWEAQAGPAAAAVMGGAVPLRSMVSPRPADARLLDGLLAGVYLVDDLDHALDLHSRSGGSCTFVTRDGTIVGRHGEVWVRDPERAEATLLQLGSEAARIRQAATDLDRRLARSTALRSSLRERISRATRAVDAATAEIHDLEKRILTLVESRRRLEEERERIQSRLDAISVERAAMGIRTDVYSEELDLGAQASAQLSGEAMGLGARLSDARSRAEDRRMAVEARATDLSAWEVVVDGHSAERARVEARMAEVLSGIADADAGVERARVELESNWRSQGRVRGEIFRSAEEKDRRIREVALLQEEVAAAKASFDVLRASIDEAEVEVRGLRREMDAVGEAVSASEREVMRVSGEIERLRERTFEHTGTSLDEAVSDWHARSTPGAEVDERREELRHLIERMGPVNVLAIKEHEEAQQRFDWLSAQAADIEKALEELETAISKMNRECRRRFKEAFEAVNERFQDLFPRLFSGGHAKLLLTNENDMLETGVEIVAQPPGKKLGNLDMMSGGEKALTAVALIFAMFKYRPSPFCFLDEVDAPLDDVNVGRVMDLLREMTDRSQFILVTHKKITMERSDILYGVTMEEPGVTKLLSVRLSPAPAEGRLPEATATAAA